MPFLVPLYKAAIFTLKGVQLQDTLASVCGSALKTNETNDKGVFGRQVDSYRTLIMRKW